MVGVNLEDLAKADGDESVQRYKRDGQSYALADLWSHEGRIDRRDYFRNQFAVLGLFGILLVAGSLTTWLGLPEKIWLLLLLPICVTGWSLEALTTRRLHDAGLQRRYLVVPLSILGFVLSAAGDFMSSDVLQLMFVISVPLAIILLLALCCPSEPRDNAYGPYTPPQQEPRQ